MTTTSEERESQITADQIAHSVCLALFPYWDKTSEDMRRQLKLAAAIVIFGYMGTVKRQHFEEAAKIVERFYVVEGPHLSDRLIAASEIARTVESIKASTIAAIRAAGEKGEA